MENPISLAVLISGGGTTLKNLWEKRLQIPANIKLVICSKANTMGVDWALEKQLVVKEVLRKQFKDTFSFSQKITQELDRVKPDLILMAGFIHRYEVPSQYQNKIMNIHPSLIPSFCGKNHYGDKVHKAVLERGVQYSGCTIHFVNNEYDQGPIITQSVVPVLFEDTPSQLQQRVFEAECKAYPQAVQWYHEKRLKIEGNRVQLLEKNSKETKKA